MELTAANTAIVVDSTADFPRRRSASRTGGSCRSTSASALRASATTSSSAPAEFYARLRTSPVTPTTSQPTPGDFLAAYEELAGVRARLLAAHRRDAVRDGRERTDAARDFGDRVRVVDTESASAAVAMLGLAIQRRLERGTTDEEVDALVDRTGASAS